MIRLTRANDFWSNMESGTRIVMRVITDEVVIDSTVTATCKCPCGTSRAYNELKFSTASDGSKPHLPEKNET